jgi:hypothetical protein
MSSTDTEIVFTYDFATTSVVERTCARRDPKKRDWYPGTDSAGATMYDNTHFATYDEALAKLRREVEASLEMGARERERIRKALANVTEELANDAEKLVKIRALEQERDPA